MNYESPVFNRKLDLIDKIIFIDGTSGSGKSLINSIVSSIEDVELPIWDALYEHLSCTYEFNQLNRNTAQALLTTFSENRLYDSYLGRHTNFRYKDSSSVFHNSRPLRNILKIFKEDKEFISKDIKEKKIILSIGSHHLMSFPSLVIDTFQEKLRIIEMTRHPASVIKFWIERNWGSRMGIDPKDFTLWIKHKEDSLPWFAANNEEPYLKMNKFEKMINGLNWINNYRLDGMKKHENIIDKVLLQIEFEKFCTNPRNEISKIERFLDKSSGKDLSKLLKKERVPRELDMKILSSEKEEILRLDIDDRTKNIFLQLCKLYEEKAGFKI
jgi:hypothetical protein